MPMYLRLRFVLPLLFVSGLWLLFSFWKTAPARLDPLPESLPFMRQQSGWADSLLKEMSLKEKIGQLLLLDPIGLTDDSVTNLIREIGPGGILVKADSSHRHIARWNRFQGNSEIPLCIGMRPEEGFRISEAFSLPDPVQLSAIRNDSLLRVISTAWANQCRQAGIHLGFSPEIGDPSSNLKGQALNPAIYFIQALHRQNIVSCARTFRPAYYPGLSEETLEDLLCPFQTLSEAGVPAIFTDGTQPNQPVSLDRDLYARLNFRGLILASVPDTARDAGKAAANLLEEGADLLIVRQDAAAVLAYLASWVQAKRSRRKWLERKSAKVLQAKRWAGLDNCETLEPGLAETKTLALELLNRRLFESALTLIHNQDGLIPIRDLKGRTFEVLEVGRKRLGIFEEMLGKYAQVRIRRMEDENSSVRLSGLKPGGPLIVALGEDALSRIRDTSFLRQLDAFRDKHQVVIVNFGWPQALSYFTDYTAIQAYSEHPLAQSLSAQLLFGGIPAQGRLPVSIDACMESGAGDFSQAIRLKHTIPEEAGLSSSRLKQIDRIVWQSIREGAMPGCQILVAKGGKVIYDKSFGHQTYQRTRAVSDADRYDLASLTKVLATTLAAMKLYEQGKLDLDAELGRYFRNTAVSIDPSISADTVFTIDTFRRKDFLKDTIRFPGRKLLPGTDTVRLEDNRLLFIDTIVYTLSSESNIFRVKIRDLLTHRSGLPPSLPVLPYQFYLKKGMGRFDRYFAPVRSDSFSVEVAGGFFLRKDYLDSIWLATRQMKVGKKDYMYSDANMILMQMAMDSLTGIRLDRFVANYFYDPLGLSHTGFFPLKDTEPNSIVPTESDSRWRRQLLRGYVHDPTAAIFGGMAGNAGLFSNAGDIAVLLQMLLNGGDYGGRRYLQPSTIRLFTATQPGGFRGLGFNKRMGDPEKDILAPSASMRSWGHTGFTGTCIWVDPDRDLIFIFLSNRVHPNAANRKLNKMDVRERIHQVIYDAILK
jgi:CubicO group peptidase (beta-lactamase class C family)